jgi:hypothetical protein
MSITTDNPPTREGSSMNEDASSYWHSRKTLAGLVLILAAAGAAWAVLGGGHSNKQTAGPAAAAYDSACGLHGGTTATPTTAPDVQWQNDDGAWLPVSTTEGPARRSTTGAWSCFAHTPTGAVLAALTIPTRLGVVGDFAGVVKQQTLPGPGQDARLKQGQNRNAANDQVTPFGFAINSYDDTAATVTFYVSKRGVSVRCASTVQWAGGTHGDWLLRLASDGSVASDCEQVPAAGQRAPGFVPWGPNS